MKEDILPIVFLTHNRTKLACATIDFLMRNLKFDGKIKLIISDDRSDSQHVKTLLETARKHLDEKDIIVLLASKERYGYGSAMNRGLEIAYLFSSVALTLEDDWILEKELDVSNYVKLIKEKDIGCIRLSTLFNIKRKPSSINVLI